MTLFSYFMVIISLSLMMSSHPVAILAIILIQSTFLCITLVTLMNSSWFSFILFLIFLGGLMVLFVYIVSLASNEKFEMNMETYTTLYFLMLMTLTLMFLTSFFQKQMFKFNMNFFSQTIMIFTKNMVVPTIIIMSYLLFTLIVAVKISSQFEGPLRNLIK